VISPLGQAGVAAVLKSLHEEQDRLPELARSALHGLAAQLRALNSEISRVEAQIVAWHKADEQSRRLATIPGVGPITASAIAAAVPDASPFRSGRQFAAWLGLTPHANSSGGKERLGGAGLEGSRSVSCWKAGGGGITKQGDGYSGACSWWARRP